MPPSPSVPSPSVPDPIELALGLQQAGRPAEAEALYRQVLAQDPDELDALNLLGVIVQERGDLAQSIRLLEHALRLDPDFAEALANLARAQLAAGDPAAASANAARAEELDPELPEPPLLLSRALFELGQVAEAAEAGHRAAALAPHSAEAHEALGRALEAQLHWEGACAAYQAAFDLQPTRVTLRVQLAGVLLMHGAFDQAVAHFRAAAAQAPGEIPPHVGLAAALESAGDIQGSIVACRRALELAPGRIDLWILQGHNFQSLGRFDDATACYQRALDLAPGSPEALRNLALIGRLTADAPQVARLNSVLTDTAAPLPERILAGFTLGSLLDKAGAYDDAFGRFQAANALTRAHLAAQNQVFDLDQLRREVDAWFPAFTPQHLERAADKGDPSDLPVFVVGMPRSGTSLVEQIAASHPRVRGIGENKDIIEIVRRLSARFPDTHPVDWDRAAIREETDAYLARLRQLGGDAERVIEKLPDNIFYVGYIAILFPRARVIHCHRDLRDVCLSCYFQHFADPNVWSVDLADCAARAREVERLSALWHDVVPLQMLDVQYERLIQDLEPESRRLIAFLGLDWDPACLNFHQTERAVHTLSQWQVRQPIYSTSIGRWRHYRAHIQPLLEGLEGLVPDDEPDASAPAER